MNLKRDLRSVSLVLTAMVCADASLCAQNFFAPSATPTVITNQRQLARMAITQPPPVYPPIAKVNYLEGDVRLQLTVDDQGRVSAVHVVQGNPVLASAALNAANHWAFRPLTTATGSSGFTALVKLKFRIHRQGMSLTSTQAEKDFQRQVKPPHAVAPDNGMHVDEVVHLRLLVDDRGQVVDRDSSTIDRAQFESACENLRGWTFEPAHWGTMPVASYLRVDVPVGSAPVTQAAAIPVPH